MQKIRPCLVKTRPARRRNKRVIAVFAILLLALGSAGCPSMPRKRVFPGDLDMATPTRAHATFREALRQDMTLYRAFHCLSRETIDRFMKVLE